MVLRTVAETKNDVGMKEVKREGSKKKLDSLTSVAAVHESQRPKLVDERDEVFYADLVATR